MKERPILFSGPLVRALLEGRKTVTRRVAKGETLRWLAPRMFRPDYVSSPANGLCPYGVAGDRLWVRETFAHLRSEDCDGCPEREESYDAHGNCPHHYLEYRASTQESQPGGWPDPDPLDGRDEASPLWKPSIHMPRWASRINLTVVASRVERLRDITDGAEVLAEGVLTSSRDGFANLWDEINAKRDGGAYTWAKNPWVWRVEFERVRE